MSLKSIHSGFFRICCSKFTAIVRCILRFNANDAKLEAEKSRIRCYPCNIQCFTKDQLKDNIICFQGPTVKSI